MIREQIKAANYRKPAYLLILLDILGFSLLFMSKGYNPRVLYTCGAVILLFVIMYTILVLCRMGDKFIMLMVFMLMSIGVLVLCRINLDYGFKQIVWILLGGAAFFVAYFIYYNVKIWDRFWYLYFILGVGLFLFTLVFGRTVNGSKNWVILGPISFQPSEITKILFIMCLACHYSGNMDKADFGKGSPQMGLDVYNLRVCGLPCVAKRLGNNTGYVLNIPVYGVCVRARQKAALY